jgi:hypothetical protein
MGRSPLHEKIELLRAIFGSLRISSAIAPGIST